jgi:hypothetical protein
MAYYNALDCFAGAFLARTNGMMKRRGVMDQALPPLQIGDRVRTRGHVLGLPPGSMGTIEYILPLGTVYAVRFDDLMEPQLLQRSALELASPADCERAVGDR